MTDSTPATAACGDPYSGIGCPDPDCKHQPATAATAGDGSYLPGRCLCEPDEYVCDACCKDGAWHDRNC